MAKKKIKRGALSGLETTALNPKKPKILEIIDQSSKTKKKPGPKSEKTKGVGYVKISVRIQDETKQKIKQSLAGKAYEIHKTQDSFIETAVLRYIDFLQKQ